MEKKLKKTHQALTEKKSSFSKYQDIIVGSKSLPYLIYFEICQWIGKLPGALGMLLRKLLWPRLFGSCGKGVMFGSEIILRHPKRIHIGNRVIISGGCILDARNNESEEVIRLEDDVMLANQVIISCKNGTIKIGARSGVGLQTIVQSATHCPVIIGPDVTIGPQCYITGGADYNTDRFDIPIWKQGNKDDGGVVLEGDIWLGAKVTVLGGVTMHQGSIAAAGAVVTKSVDEKVICGGVPAKEIKKRTAKMFN